MGVLEPRPWDEGVVVGIGEVLMEEGTRREGTGRWI